MKELTINKLISTILEQAKEKGFGTEHDEINIPEKIALIHSEISEAYEAYRKKNMEGKDGFREELADAIIRIFHLAGVEKVDLEKEIIKKMEYNKNRQWDWDNINEKHY